jgi:hypothetical protein
MVGQTSGMSSPQQNEAKSSYQCVSSNSFQGAAQQHVDLSLLVDLWGHPKAQMYSAAIEN